MSSYWHLMGALALILSYFLPAVTALPSSKRHFSTYELVDSWQGENFFNGFDFFTGMDPTNGFVTYVDQGTAKNDGLIGVTHSGGVYMGVDYTSTIDPNGAGRKSVRVETKKSYDYGLFIVDLKHMPGNACGSWPAFWTVGPSWPMDGEIDIIESVNLITSSQIVLHTEGTCLVEDRPMVGSLLTKECGSVAGTQGCLVNAGGGTFGTPFNGGGGGLYAMEWTKDHIAIWYFPRGAIPASITNDRPDVSTFGTPRALFQGPCNFADHFRAHRVVFDTTFCGDWAGGVYGESGCPIDDPSSARQSCHNYVASHPSAYKESYWEVNSVKIYQGGANSTIEFSSSAIASSARRTSTPLTASRTRSSAGVAKRTSATQTTAHGAQATAAVVSRSHAAPAETSIAVVPVIEGERNTAAVAPSLVAGLVSAAVETIVAKTETLQTNTVAHSTITAAFVSATAQANQSETETVFVTDGGDDDDDDAPSGVDAAYRSAATVTSEADAEESSATDATSQTDSTLPEAADGDGDVIDLSGLGFQFHTGDESESSVAAAHSSAAAETNEDDSEELSDTDAAAPPESVSADDEEDSTSIRITIAATPSNIASRHYPPASQPKVAGAPASAGAAQSGVAPAFTSMFDNATLTVTGRGGSAATLANAQRVTLTTTARSTGQSSLAAAAVEGDSSGSAGAAPGGSSGSDSSGGSGIPGSFDGSAAYGAYDGPESLLPASTAVPNTVNPPPDPAANQGANAPADPAASAVPNTPAGGSGNPPAGTDNPPAGGPGNPPVDGSGNPPAGGAVNPPPGASANPPANSTTSPPANTPARGSQNPPAGSANPPAGGSDNPAAGGQPNGPASAPVSSPTSSIASNLSSTHMTSQPAAPSSIPVVVPPPAPAPSSASPSPTSAHISSSAASHPASTPAPSPQPAPPLITGGHSSSVPVIPPAPGTGTGATMSTEVSPSPTAPTNPMFTGAGCKLSFHARSILGAAIVALLNSHLIPSFPWNCFR